MDVRTIEIPKEEAMQKLAAYRGLNARQKTVEDQRLEGLYKAVSKGARVININEAFKATGLNLDGQPRLAIAGADWRTVFFSGWSNGSGRFSREPWGSRKVAWNIGIPSSTFNQVVTNCNNIKSAVPHIPPDLRPKFALSNYHILFEVEKWETYPVDPFLMKHIAGGLYIVIAEWELTELEASLLGSMRG